MIKRISLGVASVALAAGATMATTAPAQAQPLVTGGLVNVTVTDSLNDVIDVRDVNVGVALALAANVCGTTVAVVAQDLASDGTCTNELTGETVTIEQR